MGILISSIIFNSILSIVIGSVFYGLPNDNAALYSRGVLLYFSIMLAAFASALEVLFVPFLMQKIALTLRADLGAVRAAAHRGETSQIRFLSPFRGSNR